MAEFKGWPKALWLTPQIMVIPSHLFMAAACYLNAMLPLLPNRFPSVIGIILGVFGCLIHSILLCITVPKDRAVRNPGSTGAAYSRGRVWIAVVCGFRLVLCIALLIVVGAIGRIPLGLLPTSDIALGVSSITLAWNIAALYVVARKTFWVNRRLPTHEEELELVLHDYDDDADEGASHGG